jgi:hypothetical protein
MLIGCCALDPRSGRRTHRPALVLYRLEEIDGRRWVVRRQAALDATTGPTVSRELVCSGVLRFELVCEGGAEAVGDQADGETAGKVKKPGPAGRKDERAKARPENCVLIRGRYFPRARLPRWARKDLPPEEWIDNDPAAGGFDPQPDDGATEDRPEPKTWRLRAWTNEQAEPTHDGIVGVG